MPRQTAPGVDNVLVVAIRRSLASAVEKALALADLSVAIVDVDHFSADVALRLNYPDTSMRYVALAAIKEQRLDISFLRNGTLESYHYHVLSSPADSVDILGALSHDFPELSSILIYGSACDEELLAQIREAASGIVDIMNPLRHVGTSDSFYPAEHLTAGSYRFAPAIGVALRRD
jgi:Tfp pilus assembly PilM family ATPase